MSRKKNFFYGMFLFVLTTATHACADKGSLTKLDVKLGSGKEAIAGKRVSVHYTGWLFDKSAPRECRRAPTLREFGTCA
ncbi:MAG: hypothetical protein CM1200mP16_06710 [Nitrospina sp.]|nr:MAG: hypothetical protein CM1200mP16_06710 [Nitrospina sp.]